MPEITWKYLCSICAKLVHPDDVSAHMAPGGADPCPRLILPALLRNVAKQQENIPMSSSGSYCAACPVDVGECPRCGTFWWRTGGKRRGIRPISAEALAKDAARFSYGHMSLNALPNAVLDKRDGRMTPSGWEPTP